MIISETNIPLFQDLNNKYQELFEFIDVPGLNVFNNDINKKFYHKELISFFIYLICHIEKQGFFIGFFWIISLS